MSRPASAPAAVGPRLSVMMFLQFFVWGAWYVSMTGWMNQVGLGALTAWAYTVGPIAACISPLFLGLVADRFFATQKVLAAMHLAGGAALIAIPGVVAGLAPDRELGFTHPYVQLLLLHMLCYMPTLGLTNTLAFHNLTDPEKQFPLIRVFGTIGWIAGNIVVGGSLAGWGLDVTWIEAGDRSPLQFYVAGGAAMALGLYSLTLPHTPPPAAGKRATVREVLGLDSLSLFSRPAYLVFIACSFLICIPLAGYYNQARNFVEHVGFENATLAMSYGQMSEILFMVLMPLCFARLGVKWMLAVGMLAWVVRYGMFGLAAEGSVASLVLAGVLLHGICYDFFFVTGFLYVDRVAPREIRGQAQGFLVLITQGLGLGLGARVVGELVEANSAEAAPNVVADWRTFWLTLSAAALVVLVAFLAMFRERREESRAR
jgi:nucleoside transporter